MYYMYYMYYLCCVTYYSNDLFLLFLLLAPLLASTTKVVMPRASYLPYNNPIPYVFSPAVLVGWLDNGWYQLEEVS